MVSLTLKVILHVAENDSKYRDVHCSSFKVTSNANDIVDAELGLKKKNIVQRVYYTLAVWWFKPFWSVGLRVLAFIFIWRFTVQTIRAVLVMRKGICSLLRKNKLWWFAERATPYNRPSVQDKQKLTLSIPEVIMI